MKRGWKIFWIIIGSITGLGVLFSGIALILGVSLSDMHLNLGELRGLRRVYSISEKVQRQPDQVWTEGEVQEFQDIRAVDMNVGMFAVEVYEIEGDTTRVDTTEIHSDDDTMFNLNVYEEGGTLKIETTKSGEIWDVLTEGFKESYSYGTLYVYLPREVVLEKADFTFGGNESWIQGLRAKETDIKLGGGDCTLDAIETDRLDVVVGAGDLELYGEIRENASVKCGAGDVEMELKGQEKDFDYSLKCGAGSVEIEEEEYGGLASVKNIDNGSNRKIDVVCGAGDIDISFY